MLGSMLNEQLDMVTKILNLRSKQSIYSGKQYIGERLAPSTD